MRLRSGVLPPLLLALAACAPRMSADPQAGPAPVGVEDVHSYARPQEARVTHVDLRLDTDFAAHRLEGAATLTVERTPGAREIVLDTRELDIRGVTTPGGEELDWVLGPADPILGRPLRVELPERGDRIAVHYRTSPNAAALQWLAPEQTAGKQHPYLFSQGQAILTRTWVPTQDSPGVRQSYSATITVPEELRAVMSAEQLTPEGERTERGRVFEFRMDQPIPPYLIALAVGDIAFRPVGPRTGVYAEPAVLDTAAYEFADLERMVAAAESLYGPYRWGRYDLLVLPPSFPFGGMENPRLTFATPTVLAGDRSLVSLVAHELAHSWSGNLVTNATWADFWLNEGFTTYFENRIMEALYGRGRADMLAHLGWETLRETVTELGGSAAPDTRLHLDLAGRDPDEGMTEIAYEKGATLLRTIERAVGREQWDAYLRSYFDRHAFEPMTTAGFLQDLRANLIRGDSALEARLRLDDWIYGPGIPGNAVVPTSIAFERVERQAEAFTRGTPAGQLPTADWSTQEWQHFLNSLPPAMTAAQLTELDAAFGLSQQGNSEILFAWLQTAVRNRYQPAVPALERFLTGQGRRKFLKPLYEGLMAQGDWGQPLARRIYAEARPTYHSVSTGTLDAIVR